MPDHERSTLSVVLVEDSVHVRHRLVRLFCESSRVRIAGEAGTLDEADYLLNSFWWSADLPSALTTRHEVCFRSLHVKSRLPAGAPPPK